MNASVTGWQYSELMDMDFDEFIEFISIIDDMSPDDDD